MKQSAMAAKKQIYPQRMWNWYKCCSQRQPKSGTQDLMQSISFGKIHNFLIRCLSSTLPAFYWTSFAWLKFCEWNKKKNAHRMFLGKRKKWLSQWSSTGKRRQTSPTSDAGQMPRNVRCDNFFFSLSLLPKGPLWAVKWTFLTERFSWNLSIFCNLSLRWSRGSVMKVSWVNTFTFRWGWNVELTNRLFSVLSFKD